MNTTITTIKERMSSEYAWRRLRQFNDIDRALSHLLKARDIPRSQHSNARKQLQQLAFSVQQAFEFAKVSENTGSTTRPLLTYYALTSLANAEILWKGSGDQSFDRRESRYNGHGLELIRADGILEYSARANANLSGLFGLWRQHSAHAPLCGKRTLNDHEVTTETHVPISLQTALKDVEPHLHPISLLECLSNIPALQDSMNKYGFTPKLARGYVEKRLRIDENQIPTKSQFLITIHPCAPETFNDVVSMFEFPPRYVDKVQTIGNYNSIAAEVDVTDPFYFRMPEGFYLDKRNTYFIGSGGHLNEFGYYYVGLYICGMISRYYPHVWIKELKKDSYVITLIDEFVDHALDRLPLLTAGVLTNEIFLYD